MGNNKGIIHKTAAKVVKTARRKRLRYPNFTIISNNCWGGVISEYFDIQKNSPTVGLYFYAEDYIKFVYNLKWYISQTLQIIPTKTSRYYINLVETGVDNSIVGTIDDIEIIFLHYTTPEDAINKWNRRCERINWEHLFIKFSEMNLCSERDLKLFDALPFKNKVMFTRLPRPEYSSSHYYSGYENESQILFDTKPANKCLDLVEFLNQPSCEYDVKTPDELLPAGLKNQE